MPETDDWLAGFAGTYDRLADRVAESHAQGDDELTLSTIRECAEFAWFHHPGRFADGRLENVALEIGERLDLRVPAKLQRELERVFARQQVGRRVLHVVSRALELGGHTKIVMSWIERDRESSHSVLLSYQSHQPFRRDLEPLVRHHGGGFLKMPVDLGNLQCVAALRTVARLGFDLVVLHSHPHDPFPTAALALPGGPPVLLLDHADHCFWLGSSVADVTVHLRRQAEVLARRRRLVKETRVLPIPLAAPKPGIVREPARKRIGIPLDQPTLISVGIGYKWTPDGCVDFYRASREVLQQIPEAHLHMIGLEQEDYDILGLPPHRRVHPRGSLPYPKVLPFQLAADVYLEPFPFGSMTATIESTLAGCAPVLGPAGDSTVLIGAGDAIEELLPRPRWEADWVAEVVALLRSPALRANRSRRLVPSVLDRHAGTAWTEALEDVYRTALAAGHRPAPIPVTVARTELEDVVVGRFARACQDRTDARQSVGRP